MYNDNILIVQTSDLTYTVQNLNYGQSYNFKVSAVSIVGESTKSSIDATPRSVPSAPTSLLINYDESVPDSVDLSWVASDAVNGSAIQSYNIYYSLDPTIQLFHKWCIDCHQYN